MAACYRGIASCVRPPGVGQQVSELYPDVLLAQWWSAALMLALVAGLGTLLVGAKALWDFSRAGPAIPEEVLKQFRAYSVFAFLRLCGWWFVVQWYLGLVGVTLYAAVLVVSGTPYHWLGALCSAALAIVVLVLYQFCRHLFFMPSSITMSLQYRATHLFRLWRMLSAARLKWVAIVGMSLASLLILVAALQLASSAEWPVLIALLAGVVAMVGMLVWNSWIAEPAAAVATGEAQAPNVVMIGCDTMRVDRLGAMNYHRKLTPNIDALVDGGALFSNCYTPLARTAPSLTSMLTGRWPHRHGIRANFVGDDGTSLDCDTLPRLLKQHGYRTSTISDWGGADLGKIDFGFEDIDVSPDQWNLKYFLRQGPMDLRLVIALFAHGRFGRACIPEIFYLPGTPLTTHMGRDARSAIKDLAGSGQPFLLNLFMATAHAPFGSEYPYYLKFSERDYNSPSKFSMASVSTPGDIVEQQESPKSRFDVPHIISLYDGCVSRFDAEVGRIVDYLKQSGLADNTIVVVYSDHGTDFFERDSWGQGNTFAPSDPSARIPMVVFDPRIKENVGVVSSVTRTVDLLPTLLEMLDLPVPEQIDGKSLAGHLRGAAAETHPPAFQETGVWLGSLPGMDEHHLSYPDILELLEIRDLHTGTLSLRRDLLATIVRAKDRMIRDGRWKLIYQPMDYGAYWQLHDLESDPECLQDFSEQQPEVFEDLKQRLIAWMEQDPSVRWDGNFMVPAEQTAAV